MIRTVRLSQITFSVLVCIDIVVIFISEVNPTDPCLILDEMKGCQVSKWFAGNRGIKISQMSQGVSSSGGYICCEVFDSRHSNFIGNEENKGHLWKGKCCLMSAFSLRNIIDHSCI